jgi:hypothetical protein
LLAAVDHCQADDPFDWSSVDIITDRNGLRKLLRWIEQTEALKDFRIDLQLAGEKTVLFNRWEPQHVEPGFPGSFGHSFEESQTVPAPGCEDGDGHHRIVTYDFSGLQMVVRFEVDACLPSKSTSRLKIEAPPLAITSGDDVDSLALLLSNTQISEPSSSAVSRVRHTPSTAIVKSDGAPFLEICAVGNLVPQKDLIELTTRSERNAATFSWREAFPQLWLSQTPHHYLAVHNRGTFSSIQRRTIEGEDLLAIAADAQQSFRKLRKVLGAIQELLIEQGREARLSLVCRNGVLEVFERTDGRNVLPDKVLKRFMM